MFISIPKDFFVPVLFSEDFRYNFETDSMEYDTEIKTSEFSKPKGREKLADIEYTISRNHRGEVKEALESEIKNIEEEVVEAEIINYVKGFMRYMEDLREAGCLDMSEKERLRLLNSYVNKFRDLYNNYKEVISNIRKPLSKSDIEGMIDYYIGKIGDIYNEHLASIKCKNLNYENIENLISQIVNDAKEVLKEQIKELNCKLVNKEEKCKTYSELENKFINDSNIYNMIDNEFVKESQNTNISTNKYSDTNNSLKNNSNTNRLFIEENSFRREFMNNRTRYDEYSYNNNPIENKQSIINDNIIEEVEKEEENLKLEGNEIQEDRIIDKIKTIEEAVIVEEDGVIEYDKFIDASENLY